MSITTAASTTAQLQAAIDAIANDAALHDETQFKARTKAIDLLGCSIIDRIDSLLLAHDTPKAAYAQPRQLAALKQQAEHLKERLEETNDTLFRRLRRDIRSSLCTGAQLRSQLERYARRNPDTQEDGGYDDLDAFVGGLLLSENAPEQTQNREREMVYYQPTPVRIILDLIDNTPFQERDIFYDLGSGLGHVAILVHLLTGVQVKGIEFEPAYCDYARRRAAELDLSGVAFLNVDARHADYGDGTIFYLYSPFVGEMLRKVLDRLEAESRERKIRIGSYGPCTRDLARQTWLKRLDQNNNQLKQLALFESL